jgi:hypothetical protein
MPDAGRLLRRYYEEVWVAGDVGALGGLLAPDYRDHDPPPGYGADAASARALAGVFVAGLEDPRLEILSLVSSAEEAAAHWRLEWTQKGPFLGRAEADGQQLSLRGSDSIRVVDGRIAEIFHVEGLLSTLRQLT